MYKWLLKTHLYFAMALTMLIVMYFASGYVLLHAGFFGSQPPQKIVHNEPLVNIETIEPEEFATYLRETHGLRGQLSYQQRTDGSWGFEFSRPGTRYEAVVSSDSKQLQITETVSGKTETFIELHRQLGYGGGLVYTLWALMLDLVSLALFVFVASGIYMWYVTSKRRALGWLMLGGSFGLTGATFLYLLI